MAELDMSEELKEALNPGIFFMHDGSGEEGVKYGRTRLLYPGGKASEIIIPRLISENTSLRQKIEDLTSISDKLVNIFKKVYPLIEEELEIDNAIKEAKRFEQFIKQVCTPRLGIFDEALYNHICVSVRLLAADGCAAERRALPRIIQYTWKMHSSLSATWHTQCG